MDAAPNAVGVPAGDAGRGVDKNRSGERQALINRRGQYGHPAPAVMERLQTQLGSESVYRTDLQGDVVLVTDGVTARLRRGR